MASRRASGTGRGDRAAIELDGAPETTVNRPKQVQLVGQPGATTSAFWPTSVYPRIESRSQRVSLRRWIALLVVLDAVIATLAVAIATLAIFGASPEKLNDRLPYGAIAATFPALWVASMLLSGSYAR